MMESPYPMSDEQRHEYRKTLADLADETIAARILALHSGRRTDCISIALEALEGALRNVCHEDAKYFNDPTILEDCHTCWGTDTEACVP